MNLTGKTVRHFSNPDRRYLVRHLNSDGTYTLESLDGRHKGSAGAKKISAVSYEVFGPEGWGPIK